MSRSSGRLWRIPRRHQIAVLVKHTGVEQFIFRFTAAALTVRRDQIVIGEGGLRYL